jgi:CheY-like chemotaxis protein
MHRSNGGLGLGLAITKQLVELQGGEVQVESRGEGRGATFTVILPIAASAQATKEPAPSDGAPEPELRGLRLLLVEDDLDSREVVSAILADWGVNVTSARNAEEALRVLGQNQVDVIVSDVGLPGMDGHAFMRAVRQTLGLRGTPALALTAYAYLEDKKRALDAGFQMHLRKPFTHTELLSVLGELAKIAHSSSV